MTMADQAKKMAAEAAIAELPASGLIGLGTGSTAKLFIEALGALVKAGRRYTGVPTSEASRAQAKALGIPLLDDEGPWAIDVTVDGADEVDERLDLIKGGGAAHLREKIVNYASARNVIVVDESKMSKRLGEKWAIPVEVVPFGHRATATQLQKLGRAELRVRDGREVRTDANNFVYDVRVPPMDDAAAIEGALRAIPGVVETGIFLRRADVVLVATSRGVVRLPLALPGAPTR